MPKISTPSNILELKGAYKKNPQRRRTAEPVAAAFRKTPPKWLTAAQKKIWREILRELAPGVLQSSDRIALEQLVVLVDEWRDDPAAFKTSRHAMMHSCLARMGMTPVDRTRIIVPKEKANKFDQAHRASA